MGIALNNSRVFHIMRCFPAIIAVLLAAAISCPAPARAGQEPPAGEHLAFGLGAFDVLDSDSKAMFSLEYRGDYLWQALRPVIGASADADGGFYAYAGGGWDIFLDDRWTLIPNFMVGAYGENGGKDLGGALEFRSGIELDYGFGGGHRVGAAFNHISNASIYDSNPGGESLMLIYALPIKVF